MFSFRACFWMSDVYINEKYKYAANEILTAYLNANDLYEDMNTDEPGHSETPGNLLYDLKSLKRKLFLSDGMDFEDYTSYNDYVYAAIRIFTKLNALLEKLPPYNQIIHFPIKTFDDLLNEHTLFFYDGRNPRDDSPITWDTITSVGFGDQMDNGNFFIRRTSFIPDDPEHMKEYDADMLQSLLEFNNDKEIARYATKPSRRQSSRGLASSISLSIVTQFLRCRMHRIGREVVPKMWG